VRCPDSLAEQQSLADAPAETSTVTGEETNAEPEMEITLVSTETDNKEDADEDQELHQHDQDQEFVKSVVSSVTGVQLGTETETEQQQDTLYPVKQVLKKKIIKKGGKNKTVYLVQYEGEEEPIWQPWENLSSAMRSEFKKQK